MLDDVLPYNYYVWSHFCYSLLLVNERIANDFWSWPTPTSFWLIWSFTDNRCQYLSNGFVNLSLWWIYYNPRCSHIHFIGTRVGAEAITCPNQKCLSRFFRINNNGFCQVIPFVVPRKCELFQEDLYPDTCSDVPAITADEWWEGKNAEPELVHVVELANHVKKVSLKYFTIVCMCLELTLRCF